MNDELPMYKKIRRKIFSKKFRKHCKHFKKSVVRLFKKTLIFKLGRAVKVVKEPSYFKDMERKNAIARYFDNVKWIFEYGRVNYSYNLFGLDIKNFRNQSDYVDVKYIKKDRMKQHHKNDPQTKHRPENITVRYSLLADNKHVFYSYIDSIKKGLVPTTYMIIQGENVISPLDSKYSSIGTVESLKTLKDGLYICKACIGAFGASISVIEIKNKKIIINKGKKTIEEFLTETSHEPYLIQSYVEQHEAISKINPGTVNTIRIITTRWNNETNILAAMLRLGANKEQLVDNASNGGTFVGIDYNTGKLMEYGYYYDKPRENKHPVSKVVYKDYQIPYFDEVIKLLKELHPILFGFSTIGWDIAITPTGPIIIEINWNYSVKGIQICSGGFRKRWDELKKK